VDIGRLVTSVSLGATTIFALGLKLATVPSRYWATGQEMRLVRRGGWLQTSPAPASPPTCRDVIDAPFSPVMPVPAIFTRSMARFLG
jgi:hypothetical protein